jgi:hypothetical protein
MYTHPTTYPFGGSPGCSPEDELKFTSKSRYCAATVWGIAREAGLLDLIPSNHSSIGHHGYETTSLGPGVNNEE